MKVVDNLFEEFLRVASAAEPKWVVEPKSYPYAVYVSQEVVRVAQEIVDRLGIKGKVERIVVKIDGLDPLIMLFKFQDIGGSRILSGDIIPGKRVGDAYVYAPNDADAKPVVWIDAISFIHSGIDPEFEDMLHVLSESAWPAYRALYNKLLDGFCQRAYAAVCSVKAK